MNRTEKTNRPLEYILIAGQVLDFTKPLHTQTSKISCSVGGDNKGKQSIEEARNGALADVVQAPKGSIPRYKYTIETTTAHPTNSFKMDASNDKSLSFRHITAVKVDAISGMSIDFRSHATKMNNDLMLLNNHLKEKPSLTEKNKIKQWEEDLLLILQEIPLEEAQIQQLNEDEVAKIVISTQRKSSVSYSGSLIAALVAAYGITAWQMLSNLGFMMASFLYMRGASLQEILPHLLSDANLPQEHLDSYVNQYLQAASLRPELTTNALFSDIENNLQFRFLIASVAVTTFLTLYLILNTIIHRACR